MTHSHGQGKRRGKLSPKPPVFNITNIPLRQEHRLLLLLFYLDGFANFSMLSFLFIYTHNSKYLLRAYYVPDSSKGMNKIVSVLRCTGTHTETCYAFQHRWQESSQEGAEVLPTGKDFRSKLGPGLPVGASLAQALHISKDQSLKCWEKYKWESMNRRMWEAHIF